MTRFVWLIPLVLFFIACGPGEEEYKPWEDETIIEFPDPHLDGCIRSYTSDTPGEPLRIKDVYFLTKITCIDSGITDLTGLEKMPWVKELQLNGNPVASLEPLRNALDLEYLDIGRGSVSNLTPLESLPNLVKLLLPVNELEDISPVSKMTSLKELNINGNKISDVNPLSSLAELETLYIYNNNIINISPLKLLLNLNYVALQDNCVSDFAPIEYLKQNGKLSDVVGDSAEEQDYARCE